MYNLYLHEQEQNKLNEELKRNYSYDKIAMVRKCIYFSTQVVISR